MEKLSQITLKKSIEIGSNPYLLLFFTRGEATMNTYGEYVIAFKSNDEKHKNMRTSVKRLPKGKAIEYYTRKLRVVWELIEQSKHKER